MRNFCCCFGCTYYMYTTGGQSEIVKKNVMGSTDQSEGYLFLLLKHACKSWRGCIVQNLVAESHAPVTHTNCTYKTPCAGCTFHTILCPAKAANQHSKPTAYHFKAAGILTQ